MDIRWEVSGNYGPNNLEDIGDVIQHFEIYGVFTFDFLEANVIKLMVIVYMIVEVMKLDKFLRQSISLRSVHYTILHGS